MITYFLRNVKLDVKKLENLTDYEHKCKYIQSFMPILKNIHNCKCPKCGAIDNFSFHCTYERNLSFCLNDSVQNFTVTVTRVICNSCSSTHALLPDFIVPYKIMASFSICKIVIESMHSSALAVSKKFSISYQLIYAYIALMLSFLPNITILHKIHNYSSVFTKSSLLINCDFCITLNFRFDYFHFFRWCFLMSKFRNTKSKEIYVGWAESPTT